MQTPVATAPDYLDLQIPAGLTLLDVPVVDATNETLKGYGELVSDRHNHTVEIARWPAQGWRPVDTDSGDEAGTVEGTFRFWWEGDVLRGQNEAVGGDYILGYSADPASASREQASGPRDHVYLWHCNYHPDGGQVFYPMNGEPFVTPLALPGDDIKPDDFVCFRFDGSCGLYIHPGIWHEGVFPTVETGSFFDKQGRVHARVSVDFAREFGLLLKVPL
ncbi:MAG: ureidoglycolate hydrolase [Alphaproteobacteria bacterium]|jgi:ureidoglycolate lyase|nr:ureidoglycolate hydrolase [Rhodospirillaceae bacterium]MBT7615529.1 ureidoglycolate hydrolase [Rhodospirillaceae bacterium]MBT7648108.1 ureidoglycolate hydrolase [Rhodospirillaceae bacterium]MDG2481242.1 ureidoglycolate hydrolase [Alphaproteobacteria bacterium]